ncbi:hypothetical protein LY76DRAFT_588204 [Colletotrichum caudatum]|nr:hypothetical protein LY76DRAFT_588204 [Colletotrichum caudatum]
MKDSRVQGSEEGHEHGIRDNLGHEMLQRRYSEDMRERVKKKHCCIGAAVLGNKETARLWSFLPPSRGSRRAFPERVAGLSTSFSPPPPPRKSQFQPLFIQTQRIPSSDERSLTVSPCRLAARFGASTSLVAFPSVTIHKSSNNSTLRHLFPSI